MSLAVSREPQTRRSRGDTPTVVACRLQSAACLFFGSIHRTYRTISVGSVNAGHAAHLSSVSLPYKMTPMCCDLSLSTVGSGSTKPSLRRSFSTSPGFPVRNSQPGLTPLLLAYSWSTLGVSSSGLRVIEYMKISRPTRSPRSEEHTSELQSRLHLVCRLLLEKKKKTMIDQNTTSALLLQYKSTKNA